MFDDMSCHVHWNFNFITQTIRLDMHSPLEIWFPCFSFVSAVDPVRFRFPLLYFILLYFFLLVNFLQQTLVNFRLISVFTLFFQSLNQQNKTINTNNERKNQKRYCIDSLRACYLFFISAVFVVWFYVNPFRSRLRLEYDISLISQKTTLNSVARSTHNVLCYCYLYWMCWCASVLFN